MKEEIVRLFSTYPQYALLLSIGLNILIAVLGVVPSVFVTAANVLFFGFWQGTLISFIGEAVGAIIAFALYRKGFKKNIEQRLEKYPRVAHLLAAEGKQAFLAVFSLRLIPFVPSGIITFTAAMGKVSYAVFSIASSLGKIPALLLEAYAAYQVTQFGWQGKLILLAAGIYMLYLVVKSFRRRGDRL